MKKVIVALVVALSVMMGMSMFSFAAAFLPQRVN